MAWSSAPGHIASYCDYSNYCDELTRERRDRTDQCEICSSARSRVFGPINPIASITTIIAPAINMNTPVVPNAFNTPAIKNDVKMAEKRLHEYTKPTARARMLVGKSSV